jgi:hypothetical protein
MFRLGLCIIHRQIYPSRHRRIVHLSSFHAPAPTTARLFSGDIIHLMVPDPPYFRTIPSPLTHALGYR